MGTPQTFPTASSPAQFTDDGSHPASTQMCAATRPISTRFEPVLALRRFDHWFLLSYTFPPLLAGPEPSGSADSSRRCQGCSHLPQRLLVQAALSFSRPLRRSAGGVLSSPHGQTAPRGARLAASKRPSTRAQHGSLPGC